MLLPRPPISPRSARIAFVRPETVRLSWAGLKAAVMAALVEAVALSTCARSCTTLFLPAVTPFGSSTATMRYSDTGVRLHVLDVPAALLKVHPADDIPEQARHAAVH